MLRSDIKIHLSPGVNQKQIMLSGGMSCTQQASYYPEAVLPHGDWRSPSSSEMAQLLTEESSPMYQIVGLVTLPQKLIETFLRQDLTTEQDLSNHQASPVHQEWLSQLCQHIQRYLDSDHKLTMTSLKSKQPNLLTVSSDQQARGEIWVGLHVDRWDKQPFHGLELARNRLTINLGQQHRHFLFVNLRVATLAEMVAKQSDQDVAHLFSHHRLLQAFVQLYPDYPVVRLTLQPGQAYIAPTENMFHDGSTLGTTGLDVHMVFRGYFHPAEVV